MLGGVVARYLDGIDGSPINEIRAMILEGLPTAMKLTDASLATLEKLSQEVIGVYFEWLQSPVSVPPWLCFGFLCTKKTFPC